MHGRGCLTYSTCMCRLCCIGRSCPGQLDLFNRPFAQGSHFTVLVTTMNRPGFALLCKYSNLTDITKIQRQCVKGRTKWMIVVEEEVVKCDQQANGSLGPKTNRYDIITDSSRFDMSKKNGMQKTGKIKAQFKVSN